MSTLKLIISEVIILKMKCSLISLFPSLLQQQKKSIISKKAFLIESNSNSLKVKHRNSENDLKQV